MTMYRHNDEEHLTTIHQAGGREIEVFVVDDDDPDLSWLGELTDERAEDCCDRHHVKTDRFGAIGYYQYFCPSFGCTTENGEELMKSNDWTPAEMVAAAESEYDLYRNWWGCGLVARTMTQQGEVEASLWGLDRNDGDYLLDEVAPELADEIEHQIEDDMFRRLMGGKPSLSRYVPA